jgi:hypothetical protein
MAQESKPDKRMGLARIRNLEEPGMDWGPYKYHCVDSNSPVKVWALIPGIGIQIRGEQSVRRTPGKPLTLSRIIGEYDSACEGFFDPALLFAVIANESRGQEVCSRYEVRINDWSFGLGQLLTNTAYGLIKGAGLKPPDLSVPQGGDVVKWKNWLCQAKNNLPLIKMYLANLNRKFSLKGDPILIYASYNAGSPRPSSTSPWGLVHHGPALDHIAAFYGDACSLLGNTRD